MQANTSVIPFAMLTGRLLLNRPNINQNKVPKANSEYMAKEMPAVFFVLMVCRACGKNDAVVQNAAIRPITVINSLLMGYKVRLFNYVSSIEPVNFVLCAKRKSDVWNVV